ncbi:MAG: J domain-containing protein [Terracidiphilus sp.]|jgi:hypothetical protein
MKTCSCGNLIDDQSSRCAHCAALQLLGLEPEAAENEIRNAYRLLVKVWSPDRFEGDDALKESAAAKLKEINSAYEFLTSTSTERGPWRPPENMAPVATSQAQTKPPVAEKAASTVELTPIGFLNTKPSFRLWPAFRIIFIAVLIVVVIVVVKDAGIALNAPYSSGPMSVNDLASGRVNPLRGIAGAEQRFLDAIEEDLHRLDPRRPAPAVIPQSEQPAHQSAESRQPVKSLPHPAQSASHLLKPYVTVGSTRDEVITQQGPPTASSEDRLVYGKSELFLKDNEVIGWRIDPVSSPIRVKLWPSTSVNPDMEYFSVGSSKDMVLVVQGTPTAFTEDKFEYGASVVYFRNNRVVSWRSDPASLPLRAR